VSAKTSQLQIRVSPEQKAALKRLAARAGVSVSEYVLTRVLPTGKIELDRRVEELRSAAVRHEALDDLLAFLEDLPADRLEQVGPPAALDDLPAVVRNQVAAAVEHAAARSGVEAPRWVREIEPPDRPHFAWELRSLRPHLMRVTPAAFKRRNVFVTNVRPPRSAPSGVGGADEAHRRLELLDGELSTTAVAVELCLVGGAVLTLVFAAEPPTRRPRDLFGPAKEVEAAAGRVADRTGAPADWLRSAARSYIDRPGLGGRLYEGDRVRAYAAAAESVLAVLCARLVVARPEEMERIEADIAYLLRFLDLRHPTDAVAVIARYLTERQHPANLEARMGELIAPLI
jgi:uncharacterized protein (DUF1778 family)